MRDFILKFWTDQAYFVGALRGLFMLLAELFRQDVIPTTIDGGGAKIAGILMILAVAIPAGNSTPTDTEGYAKVNPNAPVKPDVVVVAENVERVSADGPGGSAGRPPNVRP